MTIAFYLKKLVAFFLFPVPVVGALLLAGLFFLLFGKRQRLGKALVALGTLLLLLFANQIVPDYLLGSIEYQYHPLMGKIDGTRWIVVLGAGPARDEGLPPAYQLSASGLYRILEGIRLYRLNPGARIITTGPGAMITERFAVSEGVPQEDIVVIPDVLDTAEEARKVAALVAGQPLILVTSASHMRRALELFRRQGMQPVPAPAEYLVDRRKSDEWNPPSDGSKGLTKATVAFYELLGRAWIALKQ
jgi:uncharacterized SAM-binding protein YcdF (DUF218 family)